MGWAIYRGTELIERGDDDGQLVVNYAADTPRERPYDPDEAALASDQQDATDAYKDKLEGDKQARAIALASPGMFESIDQQINDHATVISENTTKLNTANENLDTLQNTTIPNLEQTLGLVENTAQQAKAAADNAVTGTTTEYTSTSSPTEVPGSEATWSSETPVFVVGQYYWMRSVVTYGSGATNTTSPVLISGDSAPGVGIDHIDVEYYQSIESDSLVGGAWSTTAPTWYSGMFIWTRTVTYYTDDTTSTSQPVNITGSPGEDGSGVGIESFREEYYLSTSQTELVGGEWLSTPPEWTEGKYYWTRSIITYTDQTTSTTDPIMVSGGKGASGDAGISVSSITPFFQLVTTGSSKPTQPTGSGDPAGWSKTEPDYQAQKELYRTERILYSNGSASWTEVTLVSSFTAVVSLTTKLEANEDILDELRDVTIPTLNSNLTATSNKVSSIENTVIPDLNDKLGQSQEDWDELRDTTLPAIDSRLSGAESGPVSVDRLNANEVASAIGVFLQLSAEQITAGTIDADRININEIAAGIATIIEINADRITSGEINASRLNATEIAGAIATIIEINADRITSGEINASQINALSIASAVGSFLEINVSQLTATMAEIDEAVVTKLWTDVVASRKITTDMLIVGQGNNLQADPLFLSDEVWGSAYRENTGGYHGGGMINWSYTSAERRVESQYKFEVVSGSILRVKVSRFTGLAPAGNVGLNVKCYDTSNSLIATLPLPDTITTSGNHWMDAQVQLPVNAVTASIELYKNSGFSALTRWSNISVTQAVESALLVDGAITAPKLNVVASSSTGGMSLLPDGLRAYAPDNLDEPLIEITTTGENAIAVGNSAGDRATMSPTGHVTGRVLNSPSIIYRGEELSDYLGAGGDVVAYIRDPIPQKGPVGDSIARVMSARFEAQPFHAYRLEFSGLNYQSAVGERANIVIASSIGSTEAEIPAVSFTSTNTLTSWMALNAPQGGWTYSSPPIYYVWRPNIQDGNRQVMVVVGIRNWGTAGATYYGSFDLDNNLRRHPSLAIVDLGPNELVGGYVHAETSPNPTAPTSRKYYTDTFYANSFKSYTGAGVGISTGPGASYPIQGQTPYWTAGGLQNCHIGFDHAYIRSRLSGATITSVRLRLTAQHFHSSSGGIIRVYDHNQSTIPSSISSGMTTHLTKLGDFSFGRGETKWVEVGAAFGNRLRLNTRKGLGLFPASDTSTQFYGYVRGLGDDPVAPAIRINYNRME